jgi:hypothetical protein
MATFLGRSQAGGQASAKVGENFDASARAATLCLMPGRVDLRLT